jgi:RES domain-containing protein
MLPARQLRRALAGAPLMEVAGPFHRFVQVQYVLERLGVREPAGLLDAIGSRLGGGRFNPRARLEVLYLALEAETALAEAEAILLGAGTPTRTRLASPYVHLGVDGRVMRVLDLTDDAILDRLGTSRAELAAPWRPEQAAGREAATQELGRLAHASRRIEALRYWSTKRVPDGRCLAVFPDRLRLPSELVVADDSGRLAPERLPFRRGPGQRPTSSA